MPFSQARASGSLLMYEVIAYTRSESVFTVNNVAAASWIFGGMPGFSAWNSGSNVMLSGLFASAGYALCTKGSLGYDSVSSFASNLASRLRWTTGF